MINLAALIALGGMVILSVQFLYEATETHFDFQWKQTQDQAVATYMLGGIMFIAGVFLSL